MTSQQQKQQPVTKSKRMKPAPSLPTEPLQLGESCNIWFQQHLKDGNDLLTFRIVWKMLFLFVFRC